jgi:hypothetical protein
MIVAGATALLCFPATAQATGLVEVATARITGPSSEVVRLGGVIVLQLGVPIPSADVSDEDVGFDINLSATQTVNSNFGVGAEVGYQHWAASNSYRESFDTMLRRETWGFIELGGTRWSFSSWEATLHARLACELGHWGTAWMKVGGGLFWVNPDLRGFIDQAGNYRATSHSKYVHVGGFHPSVGVDFPSLSVVKPGLSASLYYLRSQSDFGADFRAVSVGMHLSIGR